MPLLHYHKPEKAHIAYGKNIRDIIFGANDGFVSSLALIAGISAAFAAPKIVIVATVSAAIAGCISMALGAYLSVKSEHEYYQGELSREKREINEDPEQERNEIREIYRQKGFEGDDLEHIVRIISSDKERWVQVMMNEELNLQDVSEVSPIRSALFMGGSFLTTALIPLIPFFFLPVMQALFLAIILTAIAQFLVGALKTLVTGKNWLSSGIEMVVIGLIAAGLSYFIGTLFSGV